MASTMHERAFVLCYNSGRSNLIPINNNFKNMRQYYFRLKVCVAQPQYFFTSFYTSIELK